MALDKISSSPHLLPIRRVSLIFSKKNNNLNIHRIHDCDFLHVGQNGQELLLKGIKGLRGIGKY